MITRYNFIQYRLLFVCFICLKCLAASSAQELNPYHVVFISNLDDLGKDDLRFQAFATHLNQIESHFALVVNGDFAGDENLSYLKALAEIIEKRPTCRMLILQGDRDWEDSGHDGFMKISQVEWVVNSWDIPNVIWTNPHGCPGPEIITLDNHLQFIAFNTQWFNHPYAKPSGESGECSIAEHDEFYEEIEDLIDTHSDQNILIAGHMPLRSNGPYGGRFPLKDWVYPVPIISGFVTSYKQNVGSPKEINNRNYEDFAEEMLDILLARSSLTFVSGHDKHTEILRHGENYLINSGNIGEHGSVKNSRFTLMKDKTIGFVQLKYEADGAVKCNYYIHIGDIGFVTEDDHLLFQAPCENPINDIPVNDRFIPCAFELPVLAKMTLSHPDSMTLAANTDYRAGFMRKLMLGNHYRDSWTTRINVPILNLDTVQGGLIPFSLGGGRQTQSLKFHNPKGEEFVFRSVDKDPTRSLKYDFRNTVIDIILQDQTTTQHPYGALTVPDWLTSLDILHATPQLYILPDDPKLGPWRKEMGGMLGMLEERPTNNAKLKFANADRIRRTVKLIRQMYKDRDNYIDQEEYLTARMLDIYLGDWGRHEDNWKWAGYKEGKQMYYRPIPRDRDHVYSKWDGMLPWLADRKWAKVSGENFAEKINDMRSLTWQNRHMDRFLLSQADRKDWLAASQRIQKIATLEKIKSTVNKIPKQVRQFDGNQIENNLTERAKQLNKFAERYYKLLAKEVDVVGSNKKEYFDVDRNKDGSVRVRMYKIKGKRKKNKYYERTFLPDDTKEVRLFGLSGEDIFDIEGESDKSIKLRIVPGYDQDSIHDVSSVKHGGKQSIVYIGEHENDLLNLGEESRFENHAHKDAYNYNRQSFHYDTYFPLLYVFYNSDRGLDIGGFATFTKYRYGKYKFASRHRIKGRVSTNGNVAIKYEPRWNDVFGKVDVIGRLEYEKNKNFNYFFGKGLLEEYDDALLAADFYTLRYTTLGAAFGISHSFWRNAELSLLFTGYYNSEQRRKNTIADNFPNTRGIKSGFNTQLEFIADLDLRDRNDLPRTGYRLFIESKIGTDIQSEEGSFLSGIGHVELFNTFHPFTLGLRFGGAVNEGDVPYFLLRYLGRNTNLRGVRQNRYFGDKHVFANSEIRLELVNTNRAIIPMQFGLKFFLDAGKVILIGEQQKNSDWLIGYGAGIYFVPYKERLTLNLTAGFSKEESLLIQFKLGKPF